MQAGIRESDIVYVRAVATKQATFYDDGVEKDGVTLIPISRDGKKHEFILVPNDSVISANAVESIVTKKVKERYGIE